MVKGFGYMGSIKRRMGIRVNYCLVSVHMAGLGNLAPKNVQK